MNNEILKDMFFVLSSMIFALALSFYLITCFQWFSYKFKRVVFNFTRPLWHIFFVIIPITLYYTTGKWFFIYFYFAFLPSIYLWHKKLDKKLVFTARVKRFFLIFFVAIVLYNTLSFIKFNIFAKDILLPIVVAFVFSSLFEKYIAYRYMRLAKSKLDKFSDLKIVLVTASYGKTSIKNFLFELLKDKFNCHKTPRSVNTLVGIIKDINENITNDTQIYIAEAGARLRGDICEIAKFLNPHIVIVGQIGEQHIEYFKNIENIRQTKLEALNSSRLEMAFLHSSTLKDIEKNIEIYDTNLKDVSADLSGIEFSLDDKIYKTSLLGKFNATNLAACIKVAKFLKVDEKNIEKSLKNLCNIEHRLVRMDAGGKIIIDDSFNGNFEGMSSSYELVSTYPKRKVLVTPGIVESTALQNENLSKIINEVFDIIIITSPLNAQALMKHLNKTQIVILKDKNKMQEMLLKHTSSGDLILFSNDAPSFM